MSFNNNYTMIDDLPELDDLERTGPQPFQRSINSNSIRGSQYENYENLSSEHANMTKKFIRNKHNPNIQAGMIHEQNTPPVN